MLINRQPSANSSIAKMKYLNYFYIFLAIIPLCIAQERIVAPALSLSHLLPPKSFFAEIKRYLSTPETTEDLINRLQASLKFVQYTLVMHGLVFAIERGVLKQVMFQLDDVKGWYVQ